MNNEPKLEQTDGPYNSEPVSDSGLDDDAGGGSTLTVGSVASDVNVGDGSVAVEDMGVANKRSCS